MATLCRSSYLKTQYGCMRLSATTRATSLHHLQQYTETQNIYLLPKRPPCHQLRLMGCKNFNVKPLETARRADPVPARPLAPSPAPGGGCAAIRDFQKFTLMSAPSQKASKIALSRSFSHPRPLLLPSLLFDKMVGGGGDGFGQRTGSSVFSEEGERSSVRV